MGINHKTKQEQFYLASVDILQGISLFFVVTFHTLLWWDHFIDSKWPDVSFMVSIFMTTAMLIPPLFFFLYAFNVVNSLLRRTTKSDRQQSRTRLLKRTFLFFLIAEFAEGSAALVTNPEHLVNFLLTWELFHLFSFSTIFLLVIFEFAWKLEESRNYNHRKLSVSILVAILVLILGIFLIKHDYTNSKSFGQMYVDLTLDSILTRMIFEYGQNPLIPWLIFPIIGGIMAIVLDLPNKQKFEVWKNAKFLLLLGFIPLILGIWFLRIERYISTPVAYPASSSFLFIAIGVVILSTMLLILFIDLNANNSAIKLFTPLILMSKITLTTFIVHNVAFIISPELPILTLLISSETAAMVVGLLYSLFFVLVAFIWRKWHFKYSLEWGIMQLQRRQWRWWINK
ncbi:MAG: acyltransferase family protein [Candidatus Hodarchaeota archaeon]